MGRCVGRFTADNPFNTEWKILHGLAARSVFKIKLLFYTQTCDVHKYSTLWLAHWTSRKLHSVHCKTGPDGLKFKQYWIDIVSGSMTYVTTQGHYKKGQRSGSHKITAHDNVGLGSTTSNFKQNELKNKISWGYYIFNSSFRYFWFSYVFKFLLVI